MDTEQIAGPVTLAVAKWAASLTFRSVPSHVVDYAKLLLLDGIGCSVFGSRRDAGKALFRFVSKSAKEPSEATVWGRNAKVSARSAALINATSAHTTNIGDTHRATIFHTNYIMPQAALAVAEKEGLSGREVLAAIVAGNEVAIRGGLAVHIAQEAGYFTPEMRGWHSTGTLGALGASVATARLLRLNVPRMLQAIVMGGTQFSGLYRPCGPYMGKHWYAGRACANGVESAYLAQSDFVAGYRLFEDGWCFGSGAISPVYDLEAASRGLGKVWETLNVDMAIYPAKKTYYPNLDAVVDIMQTHRLRFEDVERVIVKSAFASSHAFGAYTAPRNSTEAFNSLRHAIAAAVHDGTYGFQQLEKRKFEHPAIVAFAKDRVEVVRDRALEKLLPEKWPGGAEVRTKDGKRYQKRLEHHVGQVQNPVSREQLRKKFLGMAGHLGRARAEEIIDRVEKLERLGDIQRLTRLLRAVR